MDYRENLARRPIFALNRRGIFAAPESAVEGHLVLGRFILRSDYRRGLDLILRTDIYELRSNGVLKYELPLDEIRRLAGGRDLAAATLNFGHAELTSEVVEGDAAPPANSSIYTTPRLSMVDAYVDEEAEGIVPTLHEGERIATGLWDITAAVGEALESNEEKLVVRLRHPNPQVPDDGLLEGVGPLRNNERRRIATRWLEAEELDAGNGNHRFVGYFLYGPFELTLVFN